MDLEKAGGPPMASRAIIVAVEVFMIVSRSEEHEA